jgi:2-polyprenyl-3-methyl-5-hydroxy-6-metoxy-1,4-benzoquinol methylase
MNKEERVARYSPERRSNRPLALVNSILNWIEHLGSRSHKLGRWYRNRFYRRLVERELKSACLKPGAMVLHIGCGPFPMTALYLAEMGFRVVAIDYGSAAVRSARQVVRCQSLGERITVWEADGSEIDYSPFDAVWVSLVVDDKQRIVIRALQTLRPGAYVLYRNYRGPLTLLYPRLAPQGLGLEYEHRRVTHALGKETIIVWQKFIRTA